MVADAYAELGLAPGASAAEVKAAWRSLASRWHPDRNAGAEALARMQRINLAVELIRGAAADDAIDDDGDEGGDEAAAPPPVRRRVRVTLEEAAAGCIKTLRGSHEAVCTTCAGAGWIEPARDCAACAGAGSLRRPLWFGWLGPAETCADCGGSGVERPRCADCGGAGRGERRWRCEVRFPVGVRDGDALHVGARRGGGTPALDLEVEVPRHRWFTLEDDGTLRCDLPVDGYAWVAERTIAVPTLEGPQALTLRRGECEYRLPGRGFPATRRGARADLWFRVEPRFTPHAGADLQILLDRLAAAAAAQGRDARVEAWERELEAWARERPD
ncbi:MAG: DnaJ domain-containing protein [Burkholderiales bacterium]|nr:DnaJ domain-containing protein [Burkholderiales bacterium]